MSSVPLRVGLLGAGGINSIVSNAILEGRVPGVEVVAVAGSSANSTSAKAMAERFGASAVAPEELATTDVDWVVEAAGVAAVKAHAPGLWAAGINTIIMSIGAFVDEAILAARDEAKGVRIVLPSGGIAGLDGVRALRYGGGLHTVRITTVKHPNGLRGAPYLVENGVELPADEAVTVFRGSARQAVAGFPANVNVAIALSLAGLGPDRTEVVIRSDPAATSNQQLVEAEGTAARIEARIASIPSPDNPRTSLLAGAAAVASLYEVAVG